MEYDINSEFATHIRQMTPFDLPPVMCIENTAYEFPWTKGIMSDCLNSAYHCYVSEKEGMIQAYMIFSSVLDEVHLLNICVDPQQQNKGFGTAFMHWLLAYARTNAAKTIYLEVRASNQQAIQLYEKLGFNEMGIRANYYPTKKGKEDALLFAYEIL